MALKERQMYRKFENDEVRIKISVDEQEMLYCYKDREPCFAAIKITIVDQQTDKLIGVYLRIFEKEINQRYYDNFVKKFLRDPEYRKQFLRDDEGEWMGTIEIK